MEEITVKEVTTPHLKNDKIKKIMVAIPTIGSMDTSAVHSLFEMLIDMVRLEPFGYRIILAMIPRMLVAQARELAIEKAIELKCDYTLFVDDDMVLPRGLFERLVSHDKDIVSALAFERMGDHNPNIYDLATKNESLSKDIQQISMRWKNVLNYKEVCDKDGLIKVDVVGFGCVLINMRIFQGENRIEAPYFMSQFQVGEDFFFCWKAQQKGYEVWCDTKYVLGHIGVPLMINEELYEICKEKKLKIGDSGGLTVLDKGLFK